MVDRKSATRFAIAVLSVVVFLISAIIVRGEELHIRPADSPVDRGIGTFEDPLPIHGVDHFDSLITWLSSYEGLRVAELHLHPGTYWTKGAWVQPGYCVPRAFSWIGHGDGENRPVIKLHPDAPFETDGKLRPERDAIVLRLGIGFRNNRAVPGFRVENIIFDGNEAAFPPDRYIVGGITIWRNGVTLKNVLVRNLRGHRPTVDNPIHAESFGIHVANHELGDDGPDGGVLVEDCRVEHNEARNPYFSGIYVGIKNMGRTVLPSIVRNCEVVSTEGRGGVGISLQQNLHIIDCRVDGMRYALYNDVGTVEGCFVTGMKATNLDYVALALRAARKGPVDSKFMPQKRTVWVRDSEFHFTPRAEAVAVWLDDAAKTGAEFWGPQFERCVFTSTGSLPFVDASVDAPQATPVRFVDCEMPDQRRTNTRGNSPAPQFQKSFSQ